MGACVVLFFLSLSGVLALWCLNSPTKTSTRDEHIHIPAGASLREIATILKDHSLIRSPLLFRLIIAYNHKENVLHEGDYIFSVHTSTLQVARGFMNQTALVPLIKVTIPEGSTLADFDRILSAALPNIKPGDIIKEAHGEEGVLFPDTYSLAESKSAADIVQLLKQTFDTKLTPLSSAMASSSFSRKEIITLASLIEREARGEESMGIVSGILQKRLTIHMPLQVDATFEYLFHKKSSELGTSDLESDTPFNTYTHRGLPPSPIASPGLMAIEAVLAPTDTPYLYYLTDKEGVFHYAETFDEHKKNKARYLR